MNVASQIRQQANDIDMRTQDTEILLKAIAEQMDRFTELQDDDSPHFNAAYCFVTCAMRNVELLKEHVQHVFELLKGQP